MSTYRALKGYSVKSVSSDPTNPKIGQVWYNNFTKQIKVRTEVVASWASGGSMNTAREAHGGAGEQTSGLVFGGSTGSVVNSSEAVSYTHLTLPTKRIV